jgi:predicted nucleic acid-binding Zn ribbon protein
MINNFHENFYEDEGKLPIHIDASLGKIASKIGFHNVREFSLVISEWESLIGKEASCFSRPCLLKNKVLTVEVDDSAWLETLQSRSTEIEEKILEYLGEKFSLRFVRSRFDK